MKFKTSYNKCSMYTYTYMPTCCFLLFSTNNNWHRVIIQNMSHPHEFPNADIIKIQNTDIITPCLTSCPPLPSHFSLSFLFLFATIQDREMLSTSILGFNYTACVLMITPLSCPLIVIIFEGENEEPYLHAWVSMLLWLPATQILVTHILTHLPKCWPVTTSPKFF